MKISDLASARVAIWGAGSEGIAATRALRSQFPGKRIGMIEELSQTLPEWIRKDENFTAHFGEVTLDLLKAFDVVIRSPGISIYREEIKQAREAGVEFTSGTNLWFAENAGSRSVCVTGSKGKSTTTHLIHHIITALGHTSKMAGNVGLPLLDSIGPSKDTDFYVVELSSYQISDFTGCPTVAVLLNLYPEHLDWHRSEENYYRDKMRLLTKISRSRIINRLDDRSRHYSEQLTDVVYFNSSDGFHHDETTVYLRDKPWISLSDLNILGEHNLSNICAALTAVAECGIELERHAVVAALRLFKGLNHRLTLLGKRDGVLYVNDSIATIPQATIAALRTFAHQSVTLLVGGYDRGLDQIEFARSILNESPFAIITMPMTGKLLCDQLKTLSLGTTLPMIHDAVDLQHAVSIAREITPTGGVVLLSPGAPSFNSHRNFAERGEAFANAAGLSFGSAE